MFKIMSLNWEHAGFDQTTCPGTTVFLHSNLSNDPVKCAYSHQANINSNLPYAGLVIRETKGG